MTWMVLSLASASLLGVYDVAKKVSVRENAVPIVLLMSVSVGATIWSAMLIYQSLAGNQSLPAWLAVDPITWAGHGLLAMKAALVGTSWTLAFHALKALPLSIAAPIRSTSPLWTLLLAVSYLGERPTGQQWAGIAVVLISFWAMSVVGRKEGIRFSTNRAVFVMIGATVLGAVSSIYDKVLLQEYEFSPATVQAWFSVYLLPVMIPMAWKWWRDRQRPDTDQAAHAFEFRVSILWISPLLLAADMAYFTALADPDALVSIVSALRRTSVLVALVAGSRMIGEQNLKRKAACVSGILFGVFLLLL